MKKTASEFLENADSEDALIAKNQVLNKSVELQEKNKICEVIFKNGYTANAPTCRCKVNIHTGYGKEEWGAKPNTEYYVLDIIKIIEVKI